MGEKKKLVRITTVPISLKVLLKGQHKFFSDYYEVIGVSSEGKELIEVGQNENIRVVSLSMTRSISPLLDLISLFKLYNLLKREHPFIVHSHTPKAGILGMVAARMAGVPIRLHTVAGMPLMEASGVKRKILEVVESFTYKFATKVYPNSLGLNEFILNQKFTKPEKLKVLGNGSSNGIDVSHFDPRNFSAEQNQHLKAVLGINEHDFVFIFVGRLVADKGINELLQAFDKLTKNSGDVKLVLVGSLESELDPLNSDSLNIISSNSFVKSVGFQNDVRPYFAISNCLVFPSYREGFPNVVMQAGAMGLPSIVSNINGCNEIIVEGENGTIIAPKDYEAIYESMVKFLKDPLYKEKLQQKARFMIESRYGQQVIWNALLAEYKSFESNISK